MKKYQFRPKTGQSPKRITNDHNEEVYNILNRRIQKNERLLKPSIDRKEFESFITETNLQLEKLKSNLNLIDKDSSKINIRNKKLCNERLDMSNISYRSTSLNDARNKKYSNNNIIRIDVNLELMNNKLNELKKLNFNKINRISRSNGRD